MSQRGRLIIWTAFKLEALDMGIETAQAGHRDIVTWTEKEGPSRFVKGKLHAWPLTEAIGIAESARALLAANPMPKFGKNLEGEEP
jgi:hypothetical protein